MGLRDAFAALFSKGTTQTGTIYGDPKNTGAAGGILQSNSFASPPPRGAREIAVASNKVAVLYAVTEKIGISVAAANWRLFVLRDKQGRARFAKDVQRASTRERRKALVDARRLGDLDEIQQHPLLDVLDKPNPLMVGQGFRALSQRLLDLNGEVFWLKERNAAGMPVQYWPAPASWCFRTPFIGQTNYQFTYGSFTAFLPETEVVWVKHPNTENPYGRGLGLGNALGDQIEIYEYAHKVAKQSFYNNAIPGGVVSVTNAGGAPPTKDQLDKLRESWDAQHRGIWNQMRLAWLNFDAKFTQMQPKFADAQLMELIKQSRDEIIQTFGVPPEMLGIVEHANKASIQAAQSIFAENVLVPRLEFLRNVIQTQMAPEFDDAIVVDYDSPVPDDEQFSLDVKKAAPWAFSVNEFREAAGAVALDGPDGDARPPLPEPPASAAGPGKADPAWAAELRRSLRPDSDAGQIGKAGQEQDDRDELGPDWDPDDIPEPERLISEDEMIAALASKVAAAIEDFGTQAFGALDDEGLLTDDVGAFSMTNGSVVDYLRDFSSNEVTLISDSTRSYLRDFLAKSYEEGLGIDDMVSELMSDSNFAFGGARAENIARTETLSASNFGTLDGFKQSGVIDKKVWLATPGTKGSRESHEALDGKVIGIDEEFTDTATGATGQCPGDFGDPASDCQCRCAVSAWVDDPEGFEPKAVTGRGRPLHAHADLDAKRAPHERAMKAAAAKVLAKQRAAVVKALKAAKQ